MTNILKKAASALVALAFIGMLVPSAVFADDGGVLTPTDPNPPVIVTDPAPTDTGTTTEATDSQTETATSTDTSTETATSTDTSSDDQATSTDPETETVAPFSAAATLAPLATNDGGQFDSFTDGSVNGQGGWSATGPYDQAIVDNTTGPASFGLKALRISNAVTSGSFGDQIFATPLADSVGETAATAGAYAVGTRHNHFEMAFDFISAIPNFEQPNLAVTVSPDRGDGSRMSYVKLADTPTGIDVIFYDVQGTGNPADFEPTTIATGLDRTVPHNVRLTFDAIDGPSNDVVKVYIDGTLVHTGTSWENYYRYDSGANVEQSPRLIKTVLFRISGTAAPATLGKGFFFDHVTTSASDVTSSPLPSTTTTVRAADLDTSRTATSTKWFFYNDVNDTVDNTLGSFVAGPGTAPAGTGSAQLNSTSTQKVLLGTVGKGGTRLADITALQYSTYRTSGDPALAPTLQFDFDNDLNTANPYLGRLVYEPYFTQAVTSGTWQTWDTLNDAAGTGTGNWWFSGATSLSKVAFAPNLANCTQSNPCTWAEVKAAFPQGAIANGGVLGLRVGGWSSDFVGNVDKLVFNTYASNETTDFENDAPVVAPTPVVTGGGGGRSSGGGSIVTPPVFNTSTGGQVLGAATFNFPRDLYYGLKGDDVKELQTELIAAGYSIPAGATGNFLSQTRAAVAAWQKANGVKPSAGYFGKISRAKYLLNGGFGLPTTPETTATSTATTTTSH